MDKDKAAILKIVIVVALIVIFLVVWFNTIGAPAGDEEEEVVETAFAVKDAVESWMIVQ